MEIYDFVFVDFENADKDQYACQIGIVCVTSGEIVKELKYNIQPPDNRYGRIQSSIHGLKASDTEHCETFDCLWPVIEPYFSNQTVICHGSVDMVILKKTLDYYNIEYPVIKTNIDTLKLFGKKKLTDLCREYDVKLGFHHDALNDAKALALVYQKANSGLFEVSIEKDVLLHTFEDKSDQLNYFKKNLEGKDTGHPFYNRKIVVTGDFTCSRTDIFNYLYSCGADIDSSVTKSIHYVLMGAMPGFKKVEKVNKLIFDGFNVMILTENDLEEIKEGIFDKYRTPEVIKKDVKLTYEHFFGEENYFNLQTERLDILANHEILLMGEYSGDKTYLSQLIGFLSSYAVYEMDTTTDIILLNSKTIASIISGEHDEIVQYIKSYYDKSKSINFNYVFISEDDFIKYYIFRVKNTYSDDDVVVDMFNKYIESITIEESNPEINSVPESIKFPADKNHVKIGGKYIFRLEDGRTWCPSRQLR